MVRIAIIGGSGQISKGLVSVFCRNPSYKLYIFSRNPADAKLINFYKPLLRHGIDSLNPLDQLEKFSFDIVINSAGEGSQVEHKRLGFSLFNSSEELDTRILEYLNTHPKTIYFFMSSGAIYGNNYKWPVNTNSTHKWHINQPSKNSIYALAKFTAESRHYHSKQFCIYDIRIFGYFSRYIELSSRFFLSELADCIINNRIFFTTKIDMLRDYIDQYELSNLISTIIKNKPPSGSFDIFSKSGVSKFTLLKYFQEKYNLNIHYIDCTHNKPYIKEVLDGSILTPSSLESTCSIGHVPIKTSFEIVRDEIREIIALNNK
jgi:nucleoside-diphosphate-sugar epimerase